MFERLNEKSWCKAHSLELTSVRPFHVAAWIEDFHGKLAMTARLRRWPDRELSTNRQVTPLKSRIPGRCENDPGFAATDVSFFS